MGGTEENKSTRYVGDEIYDRLCGLPGFSTVDARRMIGADWRTGSELFRDYAQPLIDGLSAAGPVPGWGETEHIRTYVERRIMGGIILPDHAPWLWAYAQMTGALLDPATVRTVLNAIMERRDGI